MELVQLERMPYGTIQVVSGWRGVGKTNYCRQVIEQFNNSGWKVSGLLTPGRFSDGGKTGILVVDVSTGQTRLLAQCITYADPASAELQLGQWRFDKKVLEWGNRQLQKLEDTDLLVIDELGPLEFEQGSGWTASFEILKQRKFRLALVVIRPEYLHAFSRMGYAFDLKVILNPPNP